jgi:hypothetical protein
MALLLNNIYEFSSQLNENTARLHKISIFFNVI